MIKRTLFPKLVKHLKEKEITFIVGPRQCGKTTVMLWLKDYLEKKKYKTLFLNLDVEADNNYFNSQSFLIKKIQLEFGKDKGYIFIDEIQRKENAGLFLKGIYDLNLPYKFIVSGSGNIELKEKIHESLAGRKRMFHLNTVSFIEFVGWKTEYKYQDIQNFLSIDVVKEQSLLFEYLNFGGYPKVVVEEKLSEKQLIIDEIYRSYLERDISFLLGVQKTDDFTRLFKIMADQSGKLVNYSEIASTLGMSQLTIKNYLWYCEKTFTLEKITPYFQNLRKEITKSPLYYYKDLGMRNYSLGCFGNINANQNVGFLFQNLIFLLLSERMLSTSEKLHFWRSKDGAEVDFVTSIGNKLTPIEVKAKSLQKPEVSRSLKGFIERYKPEKALIVNYIYKDSFKLGKTKIVFLPYFELIDNKF